MVSTGYTDLDNYLVRWTAFSWSLTFCDELLKLSLPFAVRCWWGNFLKFLPFYPLFVVFLLEKNSTKLSFVVLLRRKGFNSFDNGSCLWRGTESCIAGFGRLSNPRLKGDVRTINNRNICEIRSCMKNNGKGPTFKFVPREERRPSEVQRASRSRCLTGAVPMSADPTWIRKWLERIVLFTKCNSWPTCTTRLAIGHDVRLRPGQDWQESGNQFEIPFCHQAALCPRVTSCSILPGCISHKRRRTDGKVFYHVPQHHKT